MSQPITSACECGDKDCQRFWTLFVIDENGCWNWQRYRLRGYGRFGVGSKTGGTRRSVYAHRWIYEHLNGPIPAGLHLDHLCRNTGCVNPAHLEPVTPKVNVLRSSNFAALRFRQTHCIHGHEFTPENTYRRPDRPWTRDCRTCRRISRRRHEAAS